MAVMIVAEHEGSQRNLKQVVRRVGTWFGEYSLDLAKGELQIVLLTCRRIATVTEMQVKVNYYTANE